MSSFFTIINSRKKLLVTLKGMDEEKPQGLKIADAQT